MSPVTFSQLDPNIEEVLKLVRHHAHQLHRLINEACESNTNEKETLWENAKTQAEQLAKYENEIENWLELNRQFKRRVKKHEILAFTEIQGYLLYTARIVSGEDQGASSSGPGFQGLMDEEETSDSETLDQGTSSSGAGAGFQGIMDQDTSSSGPGFQGLMDEEETSDSETLNDQDQVAVKNDQKLW